MYFLKSLQNLGKLFNLIFPITVHKNNNAFSQNLISLSAKKPNAPFFGSEEVKARHGAYMNVKLALSIFHLSMGSVSSHKAITILRLYFYSIWEQARSQLGRRYKGKAFRISFLARNELAPSSFPTWLKIWPLVSQKVHQLGNGNQLLICDTQAPRLSILPTFSKQILKQAACINFEQKNQHVGCLWNWHQISVNQHSLRLHHKIL